MSFLRCEPGKCGFLLQKLGCQDSSTGHAGRRGTAPMADQFRKPASSVEQTCVFRYANPSPRSWLTQRLLSQKQTKAREEARNRCVLDWQSGGTEGIMTNGCHRCHRSICPVLALLTCLGREDGDGVCYSLAWCIGSPQGPWSSCQNPTHRDASSQLTKEQRKVPLFGRPAAPLHAPATDRTGRGFRENGVTPRRLLKIPSCGPFASKRLRPARWRAQKTQALDWTSEVDKRDEAVTLRSVTPVDVRQGC
jgi:hypothetical protein